MVNVHKILNITTILLISRCLPYPLHLGDRLILYHLARELAARGHIIDLIAFDDANTQPREGLKRFAGATHTPPDTTPYRDFFRHIHILREPKRTPINYLARWSGLRPRFAQQAQQAWSPAMWQLIARLRREHDYDIAHLFGGVQVYEYAPALGDLPAIITPYESYALYLRRNLAHASSNGLGTATPQQRLTRELRYQIARGFERFMFTPYHAAVVVSDVDRAELLTINPSLDVRVIANGVDLSLFRHDNTARQPHTLIFTGNYEYAPNVDAAQRLIHNIFPRVRAHFPNAHLWIVGNAPPPELQALESSHIQVTGRVPAIVPYLAQASVFVSPLRMGAGIKNKILEALAMGLPVVATSISVDGIAVQDGHSALIADTDDALAQAVIRVLSDADLQARLSDNGRALINARYTWTSVAAQYEALYAETIA